MATKSDKTIYAIVEIGGAQELVRLGEKIEVDRVFIDEGKALEIDKVLLVADGDDVKVGTPYVSGTKVVFKAVSHTKGPKIRVIRFKAKVRYRRTRGHRQPMTMLEVVKIGNFTAVATKKTPAKKAVVGAKKAPAKASKKEARVPTRSGKKK